LSGICASLRRALVKSIYLSEKAGGGREDVNALYASQFQSKTYRQILRMDKLIRAIDGDQSEGVGPGRGERRRKSLENLKRIFSDVRAANRERERIILRFPQLFFTIRAANVLLKRELGDAHRVWVPPPRETVPQGHYSTSGLYLIPTDYMREWGDPDEAEVWPHS
jgi:hypothetical protein